MYTKIAFSKRGGTTLVIQWLRIWLPVQEIQVQSLVRKDPHALEATKLMCRNYWSPHSRACASQQEKPAKGEA